MSYHKNALKAYQQAQVNTVDQLSLVTMLYEGAIRFLKLAEKNIDLKNIEQSHHYIVRSQDIITELICSLDIKSKNPIVQNLLSLYEYMFRSLVNANFKKDKKILEQVRSHFENLLEGWKQVALNRKNEQLVSKNKANEAQVNNQTPNKFTGIYG